ELAVEELNLARGFLQKNAAVRSAPACVRIWKKTANVPFAQSPQDSVANRVHEHICIGVSIQPFGMRNFHAAQDQFASRDQLMHIISNTHMIHWARIISKQWPIVSSEPRRQKTNGRSAFLLGPL